MGEPSERAALVGRQQEIEQHLFDRVTDLFGLLASEWMVSVLLIVNVRAADYTSSRIAPSIPRRSSSKWCQ